MQKFEFKALGTVITVTIWDIIDESRLRNIESMIKEFTLDYENKFSRFKEGSLLSKVNKMTGVIELPKDFVKILSIYKSLYIISNKKFTPLIGGLLEDTGYDKNLSFITKDEQESVLDFDAVIEIINETQIKKSVVCRLDFGAVGKGYLVDLLSDLLREHNIYRYMIDAGGDIYYSDLLIPVSIGLEHPTDNKLAIGKIRLTRGAICGSSIHKRSWGKYNHYLDPDTKTSNMRVSAVWVRAESCALADALTSVLFFVEPSTVTDYVFEYSMIDSNGKIKYSANFDAEYFNY